MADKHRLRDRVSLFGRLLKVTALLGVVVLLVGFFFGWFTLSMHESDTDEANRFSIVFTVNTDAFWDSAKEAREEAVGLKDSVSEASKLRTVDGEITSIDQDTRKMTIAPDGKKSESLTIQIDAESEFLLGEDKGELESLSTGDKISVTYVEKNDVKRAKKISRL